MTHMLGAAWPPGTQVRLAKRTEYEKREAMHYDMQRTGGWATELVRESVHAAHRPGHDTVRSPVQPVQQAAQEARRSREALDDAMHPRRAPAFAALHEEPPRRRPRPQTAPLVTTHNDRRSSREAERQLDVAPWTPRK
jgi:hypothetical protein